MKLIKHFTYGSRTPSKEERQNSDFLSWIAPRTIVIDECPDNDFFIDFLTNQVSGYSNYIDLSIGISNLHPDDQYDKKIGVKTATEKIQHKVFKVVSFMHSKHNDEFENLIVLESLDETISLSLRVDYKSSHPEIVYANRRGPK